MCKEILAKTNFYDILLVEKTATEEQIKKSYRKVSWFFVNLVNQLALKVHPDKNRAPSAMDAFKHIGKAYGTLSDERKRRSYD